MKTWNVFPIVVILSLTSYYRSLDGLFVFDDSVAILKNADVNGRNISIQVGVDFVIFLYCFDSDEQYV